MRRRDDCVRLTTSSAFVRLLLLCGVIGTTRQQESPFQESKTSDVALKDFPGTSVEGSLELGTAVCGDGGFDARTICIDCATAKVISSAADCCHRRQTFDLCLSVITADSDDDDNDVRVPDDEDGDNEGYRVWFPPHGDVSDGDDDDDSEDGAMEQRVDEREDKRKSPFLGKRRSPFLGKRRSPFLGKRRSPFLGKRRSPFLGKRRSPFLGKRRSPFLGKRRSPFLGKRRSPFLGKREDLTSNAHP